MMRSEANERTSSPERELYVRRSKRRPDGYAVKIVTGRMVVDGRESSDLLDLIDRSYSIAVDNDVPGLREVVEQAFAAGRASQRADDGRDE